MALLLHVVVFSILLIGEKRLERKLVDENSNLWNEVTSKTTSGIRAQGEILSLKRELEELKGRAFDPAVLTPTEARKKS